MVQFVGAQIGKECGTEEFTRCAEPFEMLHLSSEFSYAAVEKEELDKLCQYVSFFVLTFLEISIAVEFCVVFLSYEPNFLVCNLTELKGDCDHRLFGFIKICAASPVPTVAIVVVVKGILLKGILIRDLIGGFPLCFWLRLLRNFYIYLIFDVYSWCYAY